MAGKTETTGVTETAGEAVGATVGTTEGAGVSETTIKKTTGGVADWAGVHHGLGHQRGSLGDDGHWHCSGNIHGDRSGNAHWDGSGNSVGLRHWDGVWLRKIKKILKLPIDIFVQEMPYLGDALDDGSWDGDDVVDLAAVLGGGQRCVDRLGVCGQHGGLVDRHHGGVRQGGGVGDGAGDRNDGGEDLNEEEKSGLSKTVHTKMMNKLNSSCSRWSLRWLNRTV